MKNWFGESISPQRSTRQERRSDMMAMAAAVMLAVLFGWLLTPDLAATVDMLDALAAADPTPQAHDPFER